MTQIYTRGKDADSVPLAPPPRKRQQVARHVRSLAASLNAGDRLPSVSHLERQLGVARKTVVAALDQLQTEGIIEARPRSGTFVAERAFDGGRFRQQSSLASPVKAVTVFAVSSSPYYRSWVDYLVVQAAAMGIDVQCHYSCGLPDAERVANSLAPEYLGAIILSATTPQLFHYVREAGQRAVVISEPRSGFPTFTPYVCSDAEQGGYLAARHLVDLGHPAGRIAYVHWMPHDSELFSRIRWRGHAQALREAGLPEPPDVIGADRFASWREYPEILRHDMTVPGAPTAFVAWSDIEASALVLALCRAGIRVPQDVSVVGYDNLSESIESQPRLTTFDQNRTLLARRALALLLNPDDYEETRARQTAAAANDIALPSCAPLIVCRESTGPPRV